jgi:hypothetical protein
VPTWTSLLYPKTYALTAIVDWSLADVQTFGLEPDAALFLLTGLHGPARGWRDYARRDQLVEVFWGEAL